MNNLPGKVLICFFLNCCILSAYSQTDHYADSLKNRLNNIKYASETDTLLSQLFVCYFNRGQFDSTLKYSRLLLDRSIKNKNTDRLARCYYRMAISFVSLSNFDSTWHYLENIKPYIKNNPDEEMIAQYYNAIAIFYDQQAKPDSALLYLLKSAEVVENSKNKSLKKLLPQTYGNMGFQARKMNKIEKALEFALKTYSVKQFTEDSVQLLNIYNNLFLIYVDMNRPEMALPFLDTAAQLNKSVKNAEVAIFIENNYGYFFEKKEQFAKALPYYFNAYKMSEVAGFRFYLSSINGNISKIYLALNDTKNAAKYASLAAAQALELNNYYDAAALYEVLKNIAVKENRYKDALHYLELSRNYTDSSNSLEIKKNIQSLEKKYENEKKEKEILLLRTKNTEQELEAIKRNRLLAISIIAGFGLAIVLGLLYRGSKQKQAIAEKESLLQQQKVAFLEGQQQVVSLQSMVNGQETERTRIAKDLHDGLGGLFSTVKMYFSTLQHDQPSLSENELFQKSYNMIDTASVEIRRIAHNMMPEVLLKLGLVQAVQDFCNSISAGRLLQVSFQSYGMEKRLNASTEIMLYRIVQELLNNIIKHAQATETIVQFNKQEGRLTVTIEDNGKGFNLEEVQTAGHAGMETVKNRVNYLNGQLSIDSQKGVGTTVVMDFLINE